MSQPESPLSSPQSAPPLASPEPVSATPAATPPPTVPGGPVDVPSPQPALPSAQKAEDPLPAAPAATCELAAYTPALNARLQNIEALLQKIDLQQSYLPPQIRQLGTKVEGLGNIASQPALRNLLLSIISYCDLLELICERNPPVDGSPDFAHQRNYNMLNNQLRQILQDNGVTPIDITIGFDPQLHRVVGTQAPDPANPSGKIVRQTRKGYLCGSRVLRYADVTVAQ